MGYRIRQIKPESQFCEAVTVDAITQVVPVETMQNVIEECQVSEARKRKLPAQLTMLLCIAMNLFCDVSLGYVLLRLVPASGCCKTWE